VSAEINGTRQYVQLTMNNFVGVSAKDGKLLWKSEFPNGRTAVIPTPIVRDNNVYVTAGYGAGCKMVSIGPDNKVTTVYENKVIKNHHGGVILVGDHLYGHADPGWVCQNFKTGEEVWSHRDFGKGAVACADGMLYCVEEGSGTVVLVEASPAGWKEQGRFKLDPQSKIRSSSGRIWTHPVISNGKLYLRDQDLIYCYDVKAKDS
jgi:outer membrane protein assembly factor BamB